MDQEIILRTLRQNMGFKDGERVLIVMQTHTDPPEEERSRFEQMEQVGFAMYRAISEEGIAVDRLEYQPESLINGADATTEAYERLGKMQEAFGQYQIVFMPTAYSLTHTDFRKGLTKTGARIASMPGFNPAFFEKGGPLDVSADEVTRISKEVADNLRASRFVRITAAGTDLRAEIDHDLIKMSTGLMLEEGTYGNIPGAETFFPPVHRGNTNGYFTIPAGWGGPKPLECDVRFFVENGAFVKAMAVDAANQAYVEEHVRPILFGGENYEVVAEIGIGTNPAITPASVEKFGFDILLAEKIFNTAHVANGNSKAMGGKNDVPVHVDWVIPDAKIAYER